MQSMRQNQFNFESISIKIFTYKIQSDLWAKLSSILNPNQIQNLLQSVSEDLQVKVHFRLTFIFNTKIIPNRRQKYQSKMQSNLTNNLIKTNTNTNS